MSEMIMSGGLELKQENIPEIVGALKAKIERLRLETSRAQSELGFVRNSCKHPETQTGSYQGRWNYVRCLYCGKEW